MLAILLEDRKPNSVKEALSDPNWSEAIQQEYTSLMKNEIWSLVELLAAKKISCCKWVFRVQKNPDGSAGECKARLVTQGFSQTPSFDYTETFNPVIKPTTIMVVLNLALSGDWF